MKVSPRPLNMSTTKRSTRHQEEGRSKRYFKQGLSAASPLLTAAAIGGAKMAVEYIMDNYEDWDTLTELREKLPEGLGRPRPRVRDKWPMALGLTVLVLGGAALIVGKQRGLIGCGCEPKPRRAKRARAE